MPQGDRDKVKTILNKELVKGKRLGARGDVGCPNYKVPVKFKHSRFGQNSKR